MIQGVTGGRFPHRLQRDSRSTSPNKLLGNTTLGIFKSPTMSMRSRKNKPAEDQSDDRVTVYVRVRPMTKLETASAIESTIQIKGNTIYLDKPSGQIEGPLSEREFSFDRCFWTVPPPSAEAMLARTPTEPMEHTMQRYIFQEIGLKVVDNTVMGFNGALLAYGQTGSGKTWTMLGDCSMDSRTGSLSEGRGMIPRICESLFQRLAALEKDNANLSTSVQVSFMEIYEEKIYDLLSDDSNREDHRRVERPPSEALKVREHPRHGPFVEGLTSIITNNSMEQLASLLVRGNRYRTVASTELNQTSSRSHAIFTLTVTQTDTSNEVPLHTTAHVHLVDLAGSERQAQAQGNCTRLKEACKINNSLTVLGRVISELSETGSSRSYRDSKLTFLLRESLGGNSRTVVLATLSPSPEHHRDTLGTLRYAQRAKSIHNSAVVNEDPAVYIVRKLREQNESLRDEVEQLKIRLANGACDKSIAESEFASIQHSILDDWMRIRKMALPYQTVDLDTTAMSVDLSEEIIGDESNAGEILSARSKSAVPEDITLVFDGADCDEKAVNYSLNTLRPEDIRKISKTVEKMAKDASNLKILAISWRDRYRSSRINYKILDQKHKQATIDWENAIAEEKQTLLQVTSQLKTIAAQEGQNENLHILIASESAAKSSRTDEAREHQESEAVLRARLIASERRLQESRFVHDQQQYKIKKLKERNGSDASLSDGNSMAGEKVNSSVDTQRRGQFRRWSTYNEARLPIDSRRASGTAHLLSQCIHIHRIFEFAIEKNLLSRGAIIADIQAVAAATNSMSNDSSQDSSRVYDGDDPATRSMRSLLLRCRNRFERMHRDAHMLSIEHVSSRRDGPNNRTFVRVVQLLSRRSNGEIEGKCIKSLVALQSIDLERAFYARAENLVNPLRDPRTMFQCISGERAIQLGLDASSDGKVQLGTLATSLEAAMGGQSSLNCFPLTINNSFTKEPATVFYSNPIHAIKAGGLKGTPVWLAVADVMLGSSFETRMSLQSVSSKQLLQYYDSAVALEGNERRRSEHDMHAAVLYHQSQAVPRAFIEIDIDGVAGIFEEDFDMLHPENRRDLTHTILIPDPKDKSSKPCACSIQ